MLTNRKEVQKALGIDTEGNKSHKGCQIDYLIQTRFGTCSLVEIKFSAKPITKKVISEVKEKIKRLQKPKNISIRPVLIHVNGVDESVIES